MSSQTEEIVEELSEKELAPVNSTPPKPASENILAGTLMGFTAAVGYAIAIMVLRHLADNDSITWAMWISCVKAIPAAAVAVALGLYWQRHGKPFFPPVRYTVMILTSGLFMQFGSNVGFQWALSKTGMAISVPVSYASMLLLSAWMGRVQLGEVITMRSAIAMAILLVAIGLLSGGASNARSDINELNVTTLALAIGAALVAGGGWAWTGIVIRQAVTDNVTVAATIFLFSMSGVIGLGLTILLSTGMEYPTTTTNEQYSWMFLAGSFNALAFFMLTAALKYITVLRTNLINASQIAMTTVAGVVLFQETGSSFMVFGTLLTIVGLFTIGRSKEEAKQSESDV